MAIVLTTFSCVDHLFSGATAVKVNNVFPLDIITLKEKGREMRERDNTQKDRDSKG